MALSHGKDRCTSSTLAALAVVGLCLVIPGGCRSARPRGEAAQVAPPAGLADTLSVPARVPESAAALAHYATAISLELEAARLEQLFNFQQMRGGTRQPSLLRDAAALRVRAVAELDLALEESPRGALILRRNGEILLELDRVDAGIKLFEEAQRIEPADQRWYFKTATRLEMIDRDVEAARILESAMAEPSSLSRQYRHLALLEVGRLYNAANRLAEAERAFRLALETMDEVVAAASGPIGRAFAAGVAKDPTGVRRILVGVLMKQGKYDEAVRQAQIAVERATRDPRPLGALIEVYVAAGRRDEAADAARAFVKRNPASQPGVLMMMQLFAKSDMVDEAIAAGKAFLTTNASDDRIRTEIVSILRQAGRTDEAEQFVLEGSGEEAGYAETMALLDVYIEAADQAKALELSRELLEENPLDANVAFHVVGRLARGFDDEVAGRFVEEFSAAHDGDHRALYAYARVLAAIGKTEKAGEAFVALARSGAQWGNAYEGAALYLISKGDVYEAARVLLAGVEQGYVADPQTVRPHFASAASDPGAVAARLEDVMQGYDSALTTLLEIAADLYAAADDYPAAERLYRKALEDPMPHLSNYVGLAIVLYRQDKVADAIELVEGLIDSGQGPPPLVRMLVAMLSGDERYEEAKRLAKKLIAETPTDVDNRLALVGIHVDQGDFESAEEQLEIARGHAEGDEETLLRVRYYLGIVYDEQGRYSLAVSMWRANLSAAPGDADSNNALAYHYAERGENLDEALALVAKALEQDPENAAYIDTLGWVHYKTGSYDEALAALRRAASKIDDPEILDHLGDTLLATGDVEGALDSWRRALEAGPRSSHRPKIEQKIDEHAPGSPGQESAAQGEHDVRS